MNKIFHGDAWLCPFGPIKLAEDHLSPQPRRAPTKAAVVVATVHQTASNDLIKSQINQAAEVNEQLILNITII
eukprot:scaffold72_cov88-Skeletonema_dohrnii-CCMP3373.AAC.2